MLIVWWIWLPKNRVGSCLVKVDLCCFSDCWTDDDDDNTALKRSYLGVYIPVKECVSVESIVILVRFALIR